MSFAYELGAQAYRLGKGTADNPYKRATTSWYDWNRGYNTRGNRT